MRTVAKRNLSPILLILLTETLLASSPSVVAASVISDAEAFWQFSSDLSDLTGNYNGIGINSPQIIAAPDGFANALHLEGPTSEQYVNFGSANPMVLTGTLTISAWVRPDTYSTGSHNGAALLGDEDNRDWIRIGHNNVAFKVNNSTTTPTFSDDTFTVGEWQHFALTRDASNNISIYRNGVEVATGVRANTFRPEYIGLKAPNATTNYFSGYMAEVGVWDTALATDQISELFTRGADPTRDAIALWSFDSDFRNSGTHGSTLDGVAQTVSTPFIVTRAAGESTIGPGALKLRGSTAQDYIQIGDDGAGNAAGVALDGAMTISAWLNPDALGSSATFLGGTNNNWIRIESGRVYVRFGSTSNNWTPATTDFQAGEWQHFMLTRDADDNITLYRDLEEIATGTLGGTFEPLFVGLKNPEGTSTNYYSGLIDDLGIWDRVLSPIEMQTLFTRVPEPSGMILLLCGAVALLLRRRRSSCA